MPDLSHDSHSIALYLAGASHGDGDLYVMINAGPRALAFNVQEGYAGSWVRVIDTSLDGPADFCEPGTEVPLHSSSYNVEARSIVVLMH